MTTSTANRHLLSAVLKIIPKGDFQVLRILKPLVYLETPPEDLTSFAVHHEAELSPFISDAVEGLAILAGMQIQNQFVTAVLSFSEQTNLTTGANYIHTPDDVEFAKVTEFETMEKPPAPMITHDLRIRNNGGIFFNDVVFWFTFSQETNTESIHFGFSH